MIKIYMGPNCESRIAAATPAILMVFPESGKFPRTHRNIVDQLISSHPDTDTSIFTHSEMIVHYLRLAVCKDPELNARFKGVWCVHGQADTEFGFSVEDESKWPVGFLTEAWEVEAEIRTIRDERRGTENARD